MAIYKVTDTKTEQTSTVDNLNDLFEKNKLEGDTYDAFVNELVESTRLQAQMGVSIETVNPVDAVILTRDELAEATARSKNAKTNLQKMVMTALSDVNSEGDVKDQVKKILEASKSAPANIIKWFDTQKGDNKLVLGDSVRNELERVAKDRKDKRDNPNSN